MDVFKVRGLMSPTDRKKAKKCRTSFWHGFKWPNFFAARKSTLAKSSQSGETEKTMEKNVMTEKAPEKAPKKAEKSETIPSLRLSVAEERIESVPQNDTAKSNVPCSSDEPNIVPRLVSEIFKELEKKDIRVRFVQLKVDTPFVSLALTVGLALLGCLFAIIFGLVLTVRNVLWPKRHATEARMHSSHEVVVIC